MQLGSFSLVTLVSVMNTGNKKGRPNLGKVSQVFSLEKFCLPTGLDHMSKGTE